MPGSARESPSDAAPSAVRRRGRLLLKWGLCALVLLFVGWRAWGLWTRDELQRFEWNVGWLVLAGLVYLIGWAPSVWFWKQLLRRFGGEVGLPDLLRSYYCGHLGKYVPGKASVLVIRSALLKSSGIGPAASAVTAALETLLMMAAGAAVAAALSPVLLGGTALSTGDHWWHRLIAVPFLPALLVVGIGGLLLPVFSRSLTALAVRMAPSTMSDPGRPVRVEPKLVAVGLVVLALGWGLHGLSLGLTLKALSGRPIQFEHWPLWTGAVSAATVGGFVALFAPGGIGVREGLLIELLRLQPDAPEREIVVAAVLLRLVWLVAELSAAAVLYYPLGPRRSNGNRSNRMRINAEAPD